MTAAAWTGTPEALDAEDTTALAPVPAGVPATAADSDVADLLTRLTRALELGGDRLPAAAATQAAAAIDRVGERAALGIDRTVVAIAGSTGSGKSSLFNAITGFEVSRVGVRRPTTDAPVAAVWGAGAGPLLDWLDVPTRYRTERITELEGTDEEALRGLVLLDMPDHDSREVRHRRQVDRLIERVDLLVWVVDPQKYADQALHGEFLSRMTHRRDLVLMVLNQVDALPEDTAHAVLDDIARLLADDGLAGVSLLATSARTGAGVERLRHLIADAVASRAMVAARATADLREAAARLREGLADDEPAVDPGGTDSTLVKAMAGAAGVPVVLDAVEASYRRRGYAATAWPPLAWFAARGPEPLRRLRLSSAVSMADVSEVAAAEQPPRREAVLDRSNLPVPGPSARAWVDMATRDIVERAQEGLPTAWARAVDQAVAAEGDLHDELERVVATTHLDLRDPGWWRAVRVAHLVLLAAGVAGLVWLILLSGLDFLRLGGPESRIGGFPLPTALFLLGLLGGPLLWLLARRLVAAGARRRRVATESRLLVPVAATARRMVLEPVAGVLTDHRLVRDLVTL